MEYDDVPSMVGKLSRLITVAITQLTQMNNEHLDATYQWLQDEGLRHAIDCLEPPTKSGHITYWKNNWANKKRMDFAILDPENNHIGNCGLNNIDNARKKAELWIYLGASKGKGYGRSTVDQLLNKAFHELSLNRIYLRVLKDNTAAISLYRNMGFKKEGTIRCDSRHNSHFVDAIMMGILHDEYVPVGQ